LGRRPIEREPGFPNDPALPFLLDAPLVDVLPQLNRR
jgi:hypothetical protein